MMIGMEGLRTSATASLSDAFDALYSREARTVLRYLRSVVREPAVAEDICGATASSESPSSSFPEGRQLRS